MRILFMTNLPVPYRVKFFNELGKHCDLTVTFERRGAENRNKNWLIPEAKHFSSIFLRSVKAGQESALSCEIINIIRKGKFDRIIIGVYSTPTSLLAILFMTIAQIPFWINSDGGFIKNDSGLKHIIKSYFISKASGYLSTSAETSKYLCYYGANESSIYQYSFSSLRKDEILLEVLGQKIKESIREKLDIHYKNVVISVGQFIHRKGFDILLEASADLPDDIGIYIIGGEPTKEYLYLMEKYKLSNVHFIGFQSQSQLRQYYMAADLFVLPTREDVWGLVVNEAMGYGLPVITTERCLAGLELVRDNENGYLVPVDNKEIMRQAILMIFGNNCLRKMQETSLSIIKKYTIEQMVIDHIDALGINS